MAVVRWQFYDPVTLDMVDFEINPSDGGSPGYEKSIQYKTTSAPDGKVVVFEGRDEPQQMEFSGTLFTEEQFDMFVEWWNKRYQIQVTDDLGRTFWIMIDSFQPKRERAIHYPFKHSYTVTATVVDWP